MNCPKCNGILKLEENAPITQEFKGEKLQLHSPAYVCGTCRFQMLQEGQGDELRRRTADVYRRQHGLLTSSEIKACRKVLHHTQEQFADFLDVSPVSIKRWETWQVQEPIYDRLIRERCGIPSTACEGTAPPSPIYARQVQAALQSLTKRVHQIVCNPCIDTQLTILKCAESLPFLESNDDFGGITTVVFDLPSTWKAPQKQKTYDELYLAS